MAESSGHMEQATADGSCVLSFFFVFCNPLVWIIYGCSSHTFTYSEIFYMIGSLVMGLWTGWAIRWLILSGIPWCFKYLVYRVKLYRWRKRKEYERYMGIGSGTGTFY